MKKYKVLIISASLAIAIEVLYGIIMFRVDLTSSERGTFGNMFGTISAFFTGITLAGVIYTIYKQQLAEQVMREDTKKLLEAQEKSAMALQQQTELLYHTAKLNAYSSMVNSYHGLVENTADSFSIKNTYKNKRDEYLNKLEGTINSEFGNKIFS
jgi:hypothetical protein